MTGATIVAGIVVGLVGATVLTLVAIAISGAVHAAPSTGVFVGIIAGFDVLALALVLTPGVRARFGRAPAPLRAFLGAFVVTALGLATACNGVMIGLR